jgi:hypothetical protein
MTDIRAIKVSWRFIVTVGAMTMSGCGFVHDEKIIGPYRLVAVDIDEQMSVCYELGSGGCINRIDETVFAVGADARFIVAKQHPAGDRTITNYFILVIGHDSELADPKKSVVGPLSESAFLEKSRLLHLPAFLRTIDSLR